jgi:hypothetical protein
MATTRSMTSLSKRKDRIEGAYDFDWLHRTKDSHLGDVAKFSLWSLNLILLVIKYSPVGYKPLSATVGQVGPSAHGVGIQGEKGSYTAIA